MVAFATGIVSVYSSTSGVVLPAFLPTVPGLVERLGGGDPMAIASSMVVRRSPRGPVAAVDDRRAVHRGAARPATAKRSRPLFNQLLAWGMSMTVVGTLACWLLF